MDCNVFWHRGFSREEFRLDKSLPLVGIQKSPWCDQLYPESVFSRCSGSLAQHGHRPASRSPWGLSQVPGSLLWSVPRVRWHPGTLKPHITESLLCSAPGVVSRSFMLTNSRSPPPRAFQGSLDPGHRGLFGHASSQPPHSAAATPLASVVSWVG